MKSSNVYANENFGTLKFCSFRNSIFTSFFVMLVLVKLNFCSDFQYESNGIFVLRVGFFSSDKFRLFK